jgi:hypothetical protein
VVSVQIGDDLKAPVERNDLALDVLLQNPVVSKKKQKQKKRRECVQ